jgi:hypothetical protein
MPEPSASEWDRLNVAHALLRFDAIEFAANRARMHLCRAIDIQSELGCTMLQDELQSSVRKLEGLAPEVRRKTENEVLVGFLITSTAARQSRS